MLMTQAITLAKASLIGLAAAGLAASTAAAQEPTAPLKPARAERACFSLSDWSGWSAPSRDVLYLRVRNREVYRLDLVHGTSDLQSPFSHLVTVVRGSDRICAPIDLDLRISDGWGVPMPLSAKTITKLTPEEIAAIPKKYRP